MPDLSDFSTTPTTDEDPTARGSLQGVIDYYGVPAKRDGRVTYRDGRNVVHEGTIVGGDGHHVCVRLDGEEYVGRYHPLSIGYDDGMDPEDRLARRNARIDIWNDRLNQRITVEQYRERLAATYKEGWKPEETTE